MSESENVMNEVQAEVKEAPAATEETAKNTESPETAHVPEGKEVSAAAEKKKKEKNGFLTKLFSLPEKRKDRIIKYALVILVILLITNPSLIPFLPDSIASALTGVTSGLFGDVSRISSVVAINWVNIFQLILMILMLFLFKEVLTWILEKINPKCNRGKTIKNLLESSTQYLFALVGIFWGLSIVGVDVSTIFASLGIVALIIGFGAESLIADVVTGLFLIFENQYNVGDVIELDGYRGTVVNIAIRTTSVEDSGGNIKIFNNSDMRNIINQSSDVSYAVCDIPIPYETDLERAEEEIEKLLTELQEEYSDVFVKRPEYSGVQQLTNIGVFLRIVAEVEEEDRFDAARLINRKMKLGLSKAGMAMNNKL